MGYNTSETGVVVQRRATPVCHAITAEPAFSQDGQVTAWRRVVHTGVQTETVTRYSGIEDPETFTGATIDMSNTNPPHESSFTGYEAHRIGDSNLWEKIKTERTTTG